MTDPPSHDLIIQVTRELKDLLMDGLSKPSDLFFHIVQSKDGDVTVIGGDIDNEFKAYYEPGGVKWEAYEVEPTALNESLVAKGLEPINKVQIPQFRRRR